MGGNTYAVAQNAFVSLVNSKKSTIGLVKVTIAQINATQLTQSPVAVVRVGNVEVDREFTSTMFHWYDIEIDIYIKKTNAADDLFTIAEKLEETIEAEYELGDKCVFCTYMGSSPPYENWADKGVAKLCVFYRMLLERYL